MLPSEQESKHARFLCHRNPGVFTPSDEASFAGDAGVRSRESFNASWRFARFGPLAGRSIRPEPGAERWNIVASASSGRHPRGTSRKTRSMAIRKRAGVPRVGVLMSGLCST